MQSAHLADLQIAAKGHVSLWGSAVSNALLHHHSWSLSNHSH